MNKSSQKTTTTLDSGTCEPTYTRSQAVVRIADRTANKKAVLSQRWPRDARYI